MHGSNEGEARCGDIVAQLRNLRVTERHAAAPPWRRWWTPIIAVVVVAGGVTGWLGTEAMNGRAARADGDAPAGLTAEPKPRPLLVASGRIASDHTATIVAGVPGQVTAMLVEQGDTVARGQPLARIDDAAYGAVRDRQLAMLQETEAALARAEYDAERTARLREQNVVADSESAYSDAALRQARARVAAARADLALAADRLAECTVVAPFDATVLERHAEAGDYVSREAVAGGGVKTQLFTLADTGSLRVDLDVAERDIARIGPQMRCTIVPNAARERRYAGRVLRIEPRGNYGKGTVGVKVRVEAADEFVRVGGGARVEFHE